MGRSGELMSHEFNQEAWRRPLKRSRAEANAWIKKYLVVASVARGWWVVISRGRNASVLISNPSHTKNQLDLINTIPVPVNIVSKKRRRISGLISKRGNLAHHFWGMSPLAYFS